MAVKNDIVQKHDKFPKAGNTGLQGELLIKQLSWTSFVRDMTKLTKGKRAAAKMLHGMNFHSLMIPDNEREQPWFNLISL